MISITYVCLCDKLITSDKIFLHETIFPVLYFHLQIIQGNSDYALLFWLQSTSQFDESRGKVG
jgi:hypothetical protein